jgi:hypothetical protein
LALNWRAEERFAHARLAPARARPDGELAEVNGGGGERVDPDIGYGAEGAELEAAQAGAEAVRDEDQGRVADALGAAVALEREVGDGGEAVEDPEGRGEERGSRVEGEAEARGGLSGELAATHEGAALAVAGAEQAKDDGQELLGEVGGVALGRRHRRRWHCCLPIQIQLIFSGYFSFFFVHLEIKHVM